MVKAQTPTIAKIKNDASEADARALISLAICEVCDFFNVGKNMSDMQIALTADMIIESFWHLKLEEIKFCFRRAMRTEKLYDRLDGNIILGWLEAYDAERTEEAIRVSDQEASMEANALPPPAPEAMTYQEYVGALEEKARAGDAEASAKLGEIRGLEAQKARLFSAREEREKELGFNQYFYRQYLPSKKNGRKTE